MVLYWGNAALCIACGFGAWKINPTLELSMVIQTLPFYIGFAKGVLGLLEDLKFRISNEEIFITIQNFINECNQNLSINLISYHIMVTKFSFNKFLGLALLVLGIIPAVNKYVKLHPLITDIVAGFNLTMLGYASLAHRCYYAGFGTLLFGIPNFGSRFLRKMSFMDPIEVGLGLNAAAYFLFALCFGRPIKYIPIGRNFY